MAKLWFVDDSCISLQPGALKSKVEVDGRAAASFANSLPGRFEIPWNKRCVELLRLPVGNSIETELWVDAVLVPPSETGPQRGKSGDCVAHGKRTKRRCPACETLVCKRCCAVDGVRCETCFDKACRTEHEGRRRGWLIGAAFLVVVALGLFYMGAQDAGSELGKIAGMTLFAAAFMVFTAFKKRKTPDNFVPVPLTFEVCEQPPQLVGSRCGKCRERIVNVEDALWCGKCRGSLHERCESAHRCRVLRMGPDWERLALSDAA